MNSGGQYTIERWPHGWLLCSALPDCGIPATSLSECVSLFPKGAVMDSGIVHHFRASGRRQVVMCIATLEEAHTWRQEIQDSIKILRPQEQWWAGTDVGTSSAAIFSVFCDEHLKEITREFSRRSVPHDADDFGRCKRLLDLFPSWREALSKVAEAYPNTKWPKIIEHWSELEIALPEKQTEILRQINR